MAGSRAKRSWNEVEVGRVHLVVALAFLLWAVAGLLRGGLHRATLLAAVPPLAMGAFPILVVGTSRLLLRGVAKRPLVGPRWLPWTVLAGATAGAAGATLISRAAPRGIVAALWSAAVATHVGIVAASARRSPTAPPPGTGDPLADRATAALLVAALVYAFAAAVALPLALAGRLAEPVAVHLLLAGFVTLTVVGVALVLLPRFTRVAYPPWGRWALVPTLGPGPALIAYGLPSHGVAFGVGAALEAVGLVTFALLTLRVLARAPRRRVVHLAYGGAAASVLAGACLGFGFALDPPLQALVPVHGLLNTLGFVGLFVVGAVLDLYGPAPRPGLRALQLTTRGSVAGTLGGLLVATLGGVLGLDAVTRTGLALYGLAVALLLVGAAASLLRSPLGPSTLHGHRRRSDL